MASDILPRHGRVVAWHTPVSAWSSPRMESLVDTRTLAITLQEGCEGARPRVTFVFRGQYAYRNLDEGYRNELWNDFPRAVATWTWVVEDSEFAAWVMRDPLAAETFRTARVYVLATEDDVIEVLAAIEPEVVVLAPAAEGEAMPGKSDLYFKYFK